jgi:hypothetical protein
MINSENSANTLKNLLQSLRPLRMSHLPKWMYKAARKYWECNNDSNNDNNSKCFWFEMVESSNCSVTIFRSFRNISISVYCKKYRMYASFEIPRMCRKFPGKYCYGPRGVVLPTWPHDSARIDTYSEVKRQSLTVCWWCVWAGVWWLHGGSEQCSVKWGRFNAMMLNVFIIMAQIWRNTY